MFPPLSLSDSMLCLDFLPSSDLTISQFSRVCLLFLPISSKQTEAAKLTVDPTDEKSCGRICYSLLVATPSSPARHSNLFLTSC